MKLWKSLIMAFATYSKIPMPYIEWEEKSMSYLMCCFPAVGIAEGLLTVLWIFLQEYFDAGIILSGAILTVIPFLVNGGIHMDGFLDTMDAKSSYKSREEKLEILKDPHTGAFAIISCGLYLLLYFGCMTEICTDEKLLYLMAFGYVYVRILSGISVVSFPKAKKDGMAAKAQDTANRNAGRILIAEGILLGILMVIVFQVMGLFMILGGLSCFFYYKRMSFNIFGGVTGDLAGYFLQITELAFLLLIALFSKI